MLDEDQDVTSLAWQKVPAKPRAGKRPSETSPNLSRKVLAIDERASSNETNKFAILSEYNDVTCEYDSLPLDCDPPVNTSKEIETPKPPPIVLSEVSDIVGMLQYLKLKIDSKEFSYKTQRDGHVRIMVKTIQKYRELVKILKNDNIKYYTFQLKQERAFRVVVKNIHHSTPTADIKSEIESLGHIVRGVHNIKSRITKEPLHMFFIDIEPDNKNSDIYKIRHIGNAIVVIEPPRKSKDMVQCYRCQEFGHTKTYCNKKFTCVKCSLKHPTSECPKNKDSPAKCANCHESHAASYKGCRIYQELTKKKVTFTNRKTMPIYNNNDESEFLRFNNNNTQTYAQALRGETASQENSALSRIEKLLVKQSELTNNLLNMIMLLVNKLCK